MYYFGQFCSHVYDSTVGRLERTETNLMHFKSEVTWTHGNQPTSNGAACEWSLRIIF